MPQVLPLSVCLCFALISVWFLRNLWVIIFSISLSLWSFLESWLTIQHPVLHLTNVNKVITRQQARFDLKAAVCWPLKHMPPLLVQGSGYFNAKSREQHCLLLWHMVERVLQENLSTSKDWKHNGHKSYFSTFHFNKCHTYLFFKLNYIRL